MKLLKFTSLLCIAPLVMSDEVRLEDGTIYKDCVIESENDKEITIVVPVSKTIKDTLTISRDKILIIKKSTADEKEFAELNGRYSDVSALSAEDLQEGVEKLDSFIKKNGSSKKLDDAKQLAEQLKEELGKKKEVQAKEEAEAEKNKPSDAELKKYRYDIEANERLATFKEKMKQKAIIPAMISFDDLAQNYSASSAYAESREVASKVLPKLVANLGEMAKAAEEKNKKDLKADSDKTVELTAATRKSNMTPEQRAAANEKLDKWREELSKRNEVRELRKVKFYEAVGRLKEKRIRWYNPVNDLPSSIRDLERIAKTDMDRIKREMENEKSDYAGKATLAFKTAWEALEAGDLDKASGGLAELKAARVNRDYWDNLDVELSAAKAADYEKKRAEREAARAKELEERRKKQEERRKASMKELNERLKGDEKGASDKKGDKK